MENNKQQERTFTTAQAIAKAATEAQKHLNKGEDVRKVYPLEGTGKDGRWLSVLVGVEICDAETGKPLKELWIDVFRNKNPRNERHQIETALRVARSISKY